MDVGDQNRYPLLPAAGEFLEEFTRFVLKTDCLERIQYVVV